MSDFDTHLPALRARTLTAATVEADTSLGESEKLALLILIGVAENSPRPILNTGFLILDSQDSGGAVTWDGATDLPSGVLRSLRVNVLQNTEALVITTTSTLDTSSIDFTDTGLILDVDCGEGESLNTGVAISIPQHVTETTRVMITYNLLI